MNRYSNEKDEILVELTLLGNEKAFEELVIRHEKAVMGTAYKITGNDYSAQDASQDAFVSAWINLDTLKSYEKFGSWVCSIAKNCAINLYNHYRSAAADVSLNLLDNAVFCSDNGGLTALENTAELEEKLAVLSEKIREVITLHYLSGFSVAEISEKLSLPSGTVKWRLSEGRKILRKEYGVMDKNYNEKTLVQRVMKQVEELKLWRLKNDKTGFETDYKKVLKAVEGLSDSKEKEHALADVLLRGYWWLPGDKNEETLARIKESAEKSHNEDVMQSVMWTEAEKYKGEEYRNYILNVQVPYLIEHGFPKTLGYQYFWLGREFAKNGDFEKCFEYYNKALEVLEEKDVYYANALAAIYVENRRRKSKTDDLGQIGYAATGEVYKYIGGKLYFWSQPGYSYGGMDTADDSIFFNCSLCDNLIYDPDLKVGDVVSSSDGKGKFTFTADDKTVEVNGETFKNCKCFVFEGDISCVKYSETYFCPGVGIVRQLVKRRGEVNEWVLSRYEIKGGDGIIPFAKGNRWEYNLVEKQGIVCQRENVFEVVFADDDTAVLKAYTFAEFISYDENAWEGNMLYARHGYHGEKDGKEHLIDTRPAIIKAEQLAKTKREKLHTAVAKDVMNRILTTDPGFNPDYTEKGRWNFFNLFKAEEKQGKTYLDQPITYSFEWKDMRSISDEGFKVLYSWPYMALVDAVGVVWSEDWVPGYKYKGYYNAFSYTLKQTVEFEVLEDEDVKTCVGEFKNCRHITYYIKGLEKGLSYKNGRADYWFKEGVGIVKYSATYKQDTKTAIWELTELRGTGEGYFPLADSLFRKYEPRDLGDGYIASVEYNYCEEDGEVYIFRNATGNQKREYYEK